MNRISALYLLSSIANSFILPTQETTHLNGFGEKCFFKDCEFGLECVTTLKYNLWKSRECLEPVLSDFGEPCYFTDNSLITNSCKKGLDCIPTKFKSTFTCAKNDDLIKLSNQGDNCDLWEVSLYGKCIGDLRCIETLNSRKVGTCQDLELKVPYSIHSFEPIKIFTGSDLYYFKFYLPDIEKYLDSKIPYQSKYNPQKVDLLDDLKRLAVKALRYAEYSVLYNETFSPIKGVLNRTSNEFFDLLSQYNGNIQRDTTIYTYALLPDSLRFSITGKEKVIDQLTKHGIHTGGSDWVLAAGEFWIKDNILYIDNNSGSFQPPLHVLNNFARLLQHTFKDLEIVTLSWESSKITKIK